MTLNELIAKIDVYEKEGAEIDKAMDELGVDAKAIKKIRKAQEAAAEAKRTLDALMGIDPDAAAKVAADEGKPA